MNVLFISYAKSLYGANSTLISLIEKLQQDYEIKPMVLTPGEGDFYNYLTRNNIDVIPYKWYSWVTNKEKKSIKAYIKKIIRFIINLLHKRILFYKIRKKSIDIIHTNNSVTDIGLYLSKKLNIPHIWYFREFLEEDYGLKFDLGTRLSVSRIERHSTFILTNSKAVKKKYQGYFSKTVLTVYNGIDLRKFEDVNTNNINNGVIEFVIVGLIHETKNQLEVLKAIQVLSKKTDSFRLHIVGSGDPNYLNQLKEFVKSKGLSKFVTFEGYVSDIPKFLKNMNVGIIASKSEAFGRVTVEYMLSHMPVIGAKSGGTEEIIIKNETGFLYELDNYKDLSNQMEKFINEQSLIKKMGDKGYQKACEAYNLERYVNEIYKLYDSVC